MKCDLFLAKLTLIFYMHEFAGPLYDYEFISCFPFK